MNHSSPKTEKRSRFSIRSLLALTLIIALGLGWLDSARDAERWQEKYFAANSRLSITQSQVKILSESGRKRKQGDRIRRFLYGADVQGVSFADVKITIGNSAFQSTNLQDANLASAVITAGVASFQGARFDSANLTSAKLTGGSGSFQMASFADARLRGATLTGSGAAFQGASFRNADLTDATITGNPISFQAVDIDATIFEGADLTAINSTDLEGCYFSERPTYNSRTKFPKGFDPVAAGWKLAP